MDFNRIYDRRNTGSIKWDWDGMKVRSQREDLIPLWVADMDFMSPISVVEALTKRAEHGIFGYTFFDESYYNAVIRWMAERHRWNIEKEWIVPTGGVVPSINFAIRTFTKEGDGVIIQQPVYSPFISAITRNNRKLVNSPLVLENGRYGIDFEDFEKKIVENQVKLFILCSPHNPVGRVWTKEELQRIGDICVKHQVIIVSDEIHHDIVYPGHWHYPIASLGDEYADICITCTSPGKTFNLAALQIANIIIKNPDMRKKFKTFMESLALGEPSLMGNLACKTAYETGREWLDSLIVYLYENKEYVVSYIHQNIPNVRVINPEGTYLLWTDFRGTGLSDDEVYEILLKKAGVHVNKGSGFGAEGSGFIRMNIASPRKILEEALDRIEKVFR
jgi:cystathionine beta-lyase